MSANAYLALTMMHQFLNAAPANTASWMSYISFTETPGVSTQASVWASSRPEGGNTAPGAGRQFLVSGPTVTIAASGDGPRDMARNSAVEQLCDQLLKANPTLAAKWPTGVPAFGVALAGNNQ